MGPHVSMPPPRRVTTTNETASGGQPWSEVSIFLPLSVCMSCSYVCCKSQSLYAGLSPPQSGPSSSLAPSVGHNQPSWAMHSYNGYARDGQHKQQDMSGAYSGDEHLGLVADSVGAGSLYSAMPTTSATMKSRRRQRYFYGSGGDQFDDEDESNPKENPKKARQCQC